MVAAVMMTATPSNFKARRILLRLKVLLVPHKMMKSPAKKYWATDQKTLDKLISMPSNVFMPPNSLKSYSTW